MANDDELIAQAYKSIIEEGLLDRINSRATGAFQSMQGYKDVAAGTLKGAVAGATGDIAGAAAAKEQKRKGSLHGKRAKAAKYQDLLYNKINKFVDDIAVDLYKLDIQLPGADFVKLKQVLRVLLMKQFNNYLDSIK